MLYPIVMARLPWLVLPGIPHHVTQRGKPMALELESLLGRTDGCWRGGPKMGEFGGNCTCHRNPQSSHRRSNEQRQGIAKVVQNHWHQIAAGSLTDPIDQQRWCTGLEHVQTVEMIGAVVVAQSVHQAEEQSG